MNEFISILSEIESFSITVLEATIYSTMAAAILVVFILAINILARKWLTAGQMGLLWGLVLIRLAMPIGLGPESSFSLQYLFVAFVQESAPESAPVEVPDGTPVGTWRPAGFRSKEAALNNISDTDFIMIPQAKTPEVSLIDTLQQHLIFMLELFFPGPAPNLVHRSRIHPGTDAVHALALHAKSQSGSRCTDQRLLQLWKTCCEQVRIRRQIPIIVFDAVSQPSVMGAISPKLLLPTDVMDLKDEQLRLIMLHELAHITRWDLGVNWILFGLRLFHWWNPLYWLAATRFHSLREQSRDAMVLRWREQQDENNSQSDHSREYSELLLTLAQRPDVRSRWRVSLPVSILGF